METVIHQVRELADTDRTTAERLVGHSLDENQQLVIQIVGPNANTHDSSGPAMAQLPEWCNLYAGLNDEEVNALERAISVRLDLTRSIT
jgi:hypothetical protein